ncbi:MAG: alpha/beta fold hydrolase [Paracoccaceae bacterium]|nr:alpha/beta fold hydrolase [Paracoccaceae bacterium]
MSSSLEISFFGDLRVTRNGKDVSLPASRKTRALLAFLVETGRPHRRERLCELFWDLPDDPKAALRWSLSKLRKVIDGPDRVRVVADRERVAIDVEGLGIDILDVQTRLRGGDEHLSIVELEDLAMNLDGVVLEGLDESGGDAFQSWLAEVRDDAFAIRKKVLQLLAMRSGDTRKWMRLWHNLAPEDARAFEESRGKPGFAEAQNILEGPGKREIDLPAARDQRLPRQTSALRAQRIGFCDAADGTKIAYASIGSGRPILKAANWLNHLEFDWTTPIWGECFAEVARDRTLIRYDERGCGLSDWDVENLSFEAFVEDLEAVVDKLQLQRFPLIGISQGAAVAIEYAVRHPERVSGLILVGSYAAGWRHLASPEEQARREAVRNLTEVGWGTENPAYRHIFSKTFMPDAENDDLSWFDEFQRQTTSPQNAARFQDAFGDIDVRDRLGLVKVPTIVLHAKGDQRIPLAQGRAVASGIPDARFVPLESRNHVLVDYEPAWRVGMDAIRDFMKEHDL